jgi:hypothetical protein
VIALTIEKADGFVAKMQRKGIKVKWDGWDIVFFKPDRLAYEDPAGRRWGNQWGFETRISPNSAGKWLINYRLSRGVNA